jgi:hypothetical protein
MKRSLILFFVCLSIVYREFTPLTYFFSGGRAFFMLLPVLLLYLFGGLYKSRNYNIAIVIALFPLLLSHIGVRYFNGYLPKSVSILFAIGCMEYYLRTKDDKFAKYSLIAVYGSLISLALISLPILIKEPGLNRSILNMSERGMEVPVNAYFTISYKTVHSVPILVIPLFLLYRYVISRTFKIILAISIIAFYVTTVLSNAATPMFMLFMYVLFVILYNPKKSVKSNTIKLGGAVIVVIVLFNAGVFTQLLRSFQPLVEDTMQEKRIEEVVDYMETGETSGDMEEREDRYDRSLDTSLSHPLSLEEDVDSIGKHSYLLDHLAAMGLIFFIPFASLLYYRYRRPMKRMGNMKIYHVLAYSAFIFLASFKNIFAVEAAMFVCPALIIYINRKLLERRLLFSQKVMKSNILSHETKNVLGEQRVNQAARENGRLGGKDVLNIKH